MSFVGGGVVVIVVRGAAGVIVAIYTVAVGVGGVLLYHRTFAVAYDIGWHGRQACVRASLCWVLLFLLVVLMLYLSFVGVRVVAVVVGAVFCAFWAVVLVCAVGTIYC